MRITKGGKFSFSISGEHLSRGLRPSKEMPRNSEYLIECSGAVGKNKILQVIDEITRLATVHITDGFPYPQIFVFTNIIIICSSTKIYEWISGSPGSLVEKFITADVGTIWTAVDFYEYVYLSNGKIAVERSIDGIYNETTKLPLNVAACNFNGQVLICSPLPPGYTQVPVFGRWIGAMAKFFTSFVYMYNLTNDSVVMLETSVPPKIVGVLSLDSLYDLDYDIGYGIPGAQRGGYCMGVDYKTIWYLFRDTSGDCQLIEVDVSQYTMRLVKKTSFSSLIPSGESIQDGCSDGTYTYWCTSKNDGRVIKILNSSHELIDNHLFNLTPASPCLDLDQGISSIAFYNSSLYWSYVFADCPPSNNACAHYIRSDINFNIAEHQVECGSGTGSPFHQNMTRVCSSHLLQHRSYHPTYGRLHKKTVTDLSIEGEVAQNFMQNILGVKNELLITIGYSDTWHMYLHCINFTTMTIIKSLNVEEYTGMDPGGDFDSTATSAFSYIDDVIIIVRHHKTDGKSYVATFKADQDLGLLHDGVLDFMLV